MQSGGVLVDILSAIPQAMFLTGIKALKNGVKNGVTSEKNEAPELAEKATEYYVNKGINELNKKIASSKGTEINLTNNEIKDMKVIKSLKDRGILIKATTRKITSQEGSFLNFLRPLMIVGLPLIKSVLTPLAKSVLILLGLSTGMSAAAVAIQKKINISGHPSDLALCTTVLIISNDVMEDIMKIVKSIELLIQGLLIHGISETIENEAKEQKGELLPMLLETLAASIWGNSLTRKEVIRAGGGTIKTGQDF